MWRECVAIGSYGTHKIGLLWKTVWFFEDHNEQKSYGEIVMSNTVTSSGKYEKAFVACCVITLFLTVSYCDARRISIEGVGVSIRATDKIYRYKSDHLDTGSFDSGLIFPRSSIPSQVAGMEYATCDFRPAQWDTRTSDRITRIKADAAGDLLVAMPSDAASGYGWE